jgi:hypothetical protein
VRIGDRGEGGRGGIPDAVGDADIWGMVVLVPAKVMRRVDLLAEEGIEFVPNTNVGQDVDVNDLRANRYVMVIRGQ